MSKLLLTHEGGFVSLTVMAGGEGDGVQWKSDDGAVEAESIWQGLRKLADLVEKRETGECESERTMQLFRAAVSMMPAGKPA